MILSLHETSTPWHDGFVDENGFSYGRNERGNVLFGDISRLVLNQQSQYGSRYVDGILPDYPNLGIGLEIEGNSSEDYTLAVAPEHAGELVERIIAYRALQSNMVYRDRTRSFEPPTEEEVSGYVAFLQDRDLPIPGEE